MKDVPYRPIACGLHETYQLAVIRQMEIDLVWRTDGGQRLEARVRADDVFTESQAEYLRVATRTGEKHVIRLDNIESAHWAETGRPLSE
ncbi:MAG: transcriptional antiterminator, Rof [Candidatus Thiodiazotropha sp. (ex Monitilora ramsayi)]|nr:transcriptional antiterminator, Rof [Candidatus Thiodiazotropha sp. (ex Monitilora ramsayi)]